MIQAQFAEFKKHADSVVFDFESKAEASALQIESLETRVVASEGTIKQMTESAEAKYLALECAKQSLQEQLDTSMKQVRYRVFDDFFI